MQTSKDISDDSNGDKAEVKKPSMTKRSKSDVSNHTSEKDSESDSNGQNEASKLLMHLSFESQAPWKLCTYHLNSRHPGNSGASIVIV